MVFIFVAMCSIYAALLLPVPATATTFVILCILSLSYETYLHHLCTGRDLASWIRGRVRDVINDITAPFRTAVIDKLHRITHRSTSISRRYRRHRRRRHRRIGYCPRFYRPGNRKRHRPATIGNKLPLIY